MHAEQKKVSLHLDLTQVTSSVTWVNERINLAGEAFFHLPQLG